MRGTQLIVMAKAPLPGLAKTRLIPALGADGAARLAARLLAHTLQQARAADLGDVLLACAPDTTHPAFAAQAALGGVTLVPQGDGDLGARMQRLLAHALASAARALIIGTDAPALDAAVLRAADAALAQPGTDAVLVPAADGGYALLGLRREAAARASSLFEAMPWSTPQVLAETRRRLAAAGLRHAELATLHDIDEPADLQHLPGRLAVSRAPRPRPPVMTPAPASPPPARTDEDDALLADLRRALQLARSPWADAPLARLHDKGLAHHHVRLGASGVLARVPKHSQMGLSAADNLAYEAACYRRAAASGHVPRVHGLLPVSAALPHGALLVEEIVGRSARLPEDLDAIADAFAAIHTLPLPDGDAAARAPLLDAADPLAALRDEIEAQAAYLDAAALQPAARAAIDATRERFARECERAARPPKRLIAFDGHPGNFLLRPARRPRRAGRSGEGALQPPAAGPGARHALHLHHLGRGQPRGAERGRGRRLLRALAARLRHRPRAAPVVRAAARRDVAVVRHLVREVARAVTARRARRRRRRGLVGRTQQRRAGGACARAGGLLSGGGGGGAGVRGDGGVAAGVRMRCQRRRSEVAFGYAQQLARRRLGLLPAARQLLLLALGSTT